MGVSTGDIASDLSTSHCLNYTRKHPLVCALRFQTVWPLTWWSGGIIKSQRGGKKTVERWKAAWNL